MDCPLVDCSRNPFELRCVENLREDDALDLEVQPHPDLKSVEGLEGGLIIKSQPHPAPPRRVS